MPSASVIFGLLEKGFEPTHVRHELVCTEFSRLRMGMRRLIGRLLGEDGFPEAAERLRYSLFTWLTSPLPFSGFDSEPLALLGEPEMIGRLWGRDVESDCLSTLSALATLRGMENPLRTAVEEALVVALGSGARIRVFCHRTAQGAFTSMSAWAELEQAGRTGFLHTPRDYRVADPFDVLIRVGPLRRMGYAGLPGAVINAPRYHILQQFTWSGLLDDEGFGRDPLLGALHAGEGAPLRRPGESRWGGVPHWNRREVRSGTEAVSSVTTAEPDELTLFARQTPPRSETRTAVLAQIGADLGVLYPPAAEVITLRRDAVGGFEVTVAPASLLQPGESFLGWADFGDVDLGGAQAKDGVYSTVWKTRLRELLASEPTGLEIQLRRGGIDLRGLRLCLENWARPATSVIHAPQQRRHFEILIRVIGIEEASTPERRASRSPWWMRAWAEIARSRGQAVQVGMQEHEIIAEELMEVLDSAAPLLGAFAAQGRTFQLPLFRSGLPDLVTFYRIEAVETGYRAPDTTLKTILSLDEAYEWRV